MPPGGDIKEISARLSERALSLCTDLFPGGHREGHDYVAPARRAGGPGDSLKIRIAGPDRGHYKHFGEGHGGDLLDLLAHYRCGGDLKEARREARRWLGLEPGESAARSRRPNDARPAQLADDAQQAEQKQRAKRAAKAIYLGGLEELAGTPVDWYLKGRGIDLAQLPAPPRALRYHPTLDYPWEHVAQRPAPPGLARMPAMVAHVCGLDGEQIAVHRTYLEIVKPGTAVKLGQHTTGLCVGGTDKPVDAKLTKASPKGGMIRLSNGQIVERATGWIKPGAPLKLVPERMASGKWDSAAFDKIYIAEGIENALTWATAWPECRVASAVSLANMAHVRLPDFIATVVLIKDGFKASLTERQRREIVKHFDRAIWWFRGHAKIVKVVEAPEGDLNSYWQRARGAA